MTESAEDSKPARRDVLVLAAGAFVAAGGALAMWPFLDQMNPHGGSRPSGSIEVDISGIKPGQMITVAWKGQPILIRHRMSDEIRRVRAADANDRIDRFARNEALPEKAASDDRNRTKPGHEQWLVVVGLCTHMNCKLVEDSAVRDADSQIAFFCPCHAARFDHSGRVLSGPATTNLKIPPYRFIDDRKIVIG